MAAAMNLRAEVAHRHSQRRKRGKDTSAVLKLLSRFKRTARMRRTSPAAMPRLSRGGLRLTIALNWYRRSRGSKQRHENAGCRVTYVLA